MSRNTSVTLGDHFAEFIQSQVADGRYESNSEAVCAGLRLLEEHEAKLDLLRQRLSIAEKQLNVEQGPDGEAFMKGLLV